MIKPSPDLPPLSPSADVPLVPGSGIQFLDLPLALDRLGVKLDFHEEPRAEGVAALKRLAPSEDGDGFTYQRDGRAVFVAAEDAYAMTQQTALAAFLGKWVPVPFLQVEVDGEPGRRQLGRGPENWARLRIVKLAEPERSGATHRAVLAFDTATAPRSPGAGFVAPWADEPARYALATRESEMAFWLDRRWVRSWIARLWRERDGAAAGDGETGARHLAAYLTLLATLEAAGAVPPVRLIDFAAAERSGGVIDVDLVLDLGNSRSCGFLIEQTPGRPASVADSYRLALRDLSQPEEVHDEPFESRVEFARAGFGFEEFSLDSGRGLAFEWGSPVRIGPEAARLSAQNRGNEGLTGLSSPKRYLWDEAARLAPWRFNPATDAEGAIRGHFLRFVAEDGTVLSYRRRKGIALRPLFSRASLFSFFLLEVLMQARQQVNSYAARYGRQDLAAPRRLRRLILTLPPAMPVEETRKVRERARAAVFLFHDLIGRPDEAARFEIEARLDEATASQIVFLYDQVSHAYRGDAPAYFALAGRRRDGEAEPSLRIASIDVGGGTTDLAILTYRLADRVIIPREEFREGFRIAGDDVLETVVMRHVMPALRRALAESGLGHGRAQQFLVGLFRVPAGTEPERQARRLALNHVLGPAALGVLAAYEAWDPLAPGAPGTTTLGALIAARGDPRGLRAHYPEPRGPGRSREPAGLRAAAWLDQKAAEAGAASFRVLDVPVELDFAQVHETVRQTLRDALDPLAEIVHRFACDLLLLTGRGARWPAAVETVTEALAVEPNRVQPMHRYRVSAWYPYADASGRIHDPKTTVAVGAMLCRLLRGGQLDNLALVEKFAMRSTARYIGLMESDRRIRADRILFSALDLDAAAAPGEVAERPLPFSGRTFIGFKQFRAERWPASPIYCIEFTSAEAARGLMLPLKLTLKRTPPDEAQSDAAALFDVDDQVYDANGNPLIKPVRLRLQTLPGEGGSFWLDTGQLDTLDAILDALPG
ncbi:hypothetical protein FK498_16385 [Elioraea sp. Yellowstone]|jgi:hypothetical protein|uniref:virulence factor SrfB n=1 Tax=Elioraea sp. Yellowstone TaxID=2592070 RepID=UPI001150B03F|nr:virulence factor SrfB [Elioraea sp. Yellowstone]TQF76706.1 hypothetical protein FK498_16385 [Elioraea sp. Yellowstone]